MLNISFILSEDLPPGIPVEMCARKGTITVSLSPEVYSAAAARALNEAVSQILAGGQWFQLWDGEIIGANSPDFEEDCGEGQRFAGRTDAPPASRGSDAFGVRYVLYDLPARLSVGVAERRGGIIMLLSRHVYTAEAAAALNDASQKLLAERSLIQLWHGEIVPVGDSPQTDDGGCDGRVHRGSLADQAPGSRHR